MDGILKLRPIIIEFVVLVQLRRYVKKNDAKQKVNKN